jgi:hypothetical protein
VVGGEDGLAWQKEEEDLCCHYSTDQWEQNTDLVDEPPAFMLSTLVIVWFPRPQNQLRNNLDFCGQRKISKKDFLFISATT